MALARNPKVVQLAKDLGLNWHGDCLVQIREHALAHVDKVAQESLIPISDLDSLRSMVADKFRVRLDFIREDTDVERIATEHSGFHSFLRQRLELEFLQGDTEGILLERELWDPRFFRYLAVVDVRAERGARAYFTAWHELAHLLVHPVQLAFPGFRRTPPVAQREKDPIESVVDHIAGRVAFYAPFFRPALEKAMEKYGGLSFAALEAARIAAAPTASLFATAMGSISLVDAPSIFLSADMSLKAAERRSAQTGQTSFDFATPLYETKLRVTTVVPSAAGSRSPLSIRRNMRIPPGSVLEKAHASSTDVTLTAEENQDWWETSRDGRLAPLPLLVEAAKRGRYVYGLITIPETSRRSEVSAKRHPGRANPPR